MNPNTYDPSFPAVSISYIDFLVISVWIYRRFNYKPLEFDATTCLIAVKYDWGLKNLEIIITFGKWIG